MSAVAPVGGRRYRPATFAPLHHLWDVGLVIAGVSLIFGFQFKPFAVMVGVVNCLSGAWLFLSTHHVLNTWVVTTSDQIVKIHPRLFLAMRWDQITDVLVRERPFGMMLGRADRMVILQGRWGRLPLNTSVLSVAEEEELLTEISSRVSCPIRTIQDGPLSGGGWVPQR
jgi:hypothetical protein